jgi:hypothetical protein
MFPLSTTMNGQCMAVPDTCQVPAPPLPPIPTPFPNVAMVMQALPPTCSLKVKVMQMAVVTQMSQIPMTSGDEAGSVGGVVSGMIKGPAAFTKGSAKLMIEGQPAVFQTCTTGQNGTSANAPSGLQVAPSQPKVMVAM